jgi:hypothetical protein
VLKTDVPVKLAGSRFVDGDVSLLIDGSSDTAVSGIKVSNVKVKDLSNLEATLSIDEKAKPGDHQIQVKGSGGISGTKPFTVAAP